jgi:hypothetical protein
MQYIGLKCVQHLKGLGENIVRLEPADIAFRFIALFATSPALAKPALLDLHAAQDNDGLALIGLLSP